MDRFGHLLRQYSGAQQILKKQKALCRARKEVDINGNGTSGYMIKHGPRQGTVLGHIKIQPKAI